MAERSWGRKTVSKKYKILVLIKTWDIYIFYPLDNSHFVRSFFIIVVLRKLFQRVEYLCVKPHGYNKGIFYKFHVSLLCLLFCNNQSRGQN